jgi:2-keto-4-pentenoate hydratase/2-oxohepta-3-ene-1,7-dioic acid hydratase in catechol pathway/regulator of RNase E activity RraA
VDSPSPSKVIAVHINYRARAEQRGRVPDVPSYFLKPPSSVSTGDAPIVLPQGTELLVPEGEIAVVIGTRAHHVAPEDGLRHVGAYAAANDVGLHDLRWADRGSNLFSKGQDGFTPLGPLATAAGVDPAALVLRTRVNGEVVQEDSGANLLFGFGLLIADLSRFVTLEPGDVILTGTPAGAVTVGPGDVVEVELVGLSKTTNTVVAASAPIAAHGAQPRVTPATRAHALGIPEPRPVTLSPEAEAALLSVSTATLTVQLRKHGIRDSFVRGLRSTRPDLRLLGYARTLRYVPLREDVRDADTAALNAQKRAVESVGPGDVLVMDARQDAGAGTIGDILAARAMVRGAAGIVTDGGLRDSEAVAGLDLPTYYQAPHAAVLGLIHYPLETDVPIACGGALVMPGDVIVGDGDGVLVLPAALAEEIALASVEQERREAWALERVLDGESIRGIYPLSPARQADYDAWAAARQDPTTPDPTTSPS